MAQGYGSQLPPAAIAPFLPPKLRQFAGRNIHALDPYRMPGPAAEARGYAAGAAVLAAHRAANGGAYPETVAVNLWGLDAIKTKGESVALAAWLVGARPVKEGTGRVARFELVPLEELGRPRVDVLCNMSGIFRCARGRGPVQTTCFCLQWHCLQHVGHLPVRSTPRHWCLCL